MKYRDFADMGQYPPARWITAIIHGGDLHHGRLSRRVRAAYVVGSRAKGTARDNITIALIIDPVRGKTSLQFTEQYHDKYPSNAAMPRWNGKVVDFQFFYGLDEIAEYDKIKIFDNTEAAPQQGDTCECCGEETDSIMQAPRRSGFRSVCESCLSQLENMNE